MKALKDCEWKIKIQSIDISILKQEFYWEARISGNSGLDYIPIKLSMNGTYKNKETVVKHWEKFAKLNGITNYKIIGELN